MKSKYKIIISIAIVIILISTAVIVFYPHNNNTQYCNNAKSFKLKYAPMNKCFSDYNVINSSESSHSIKDGKASYLNSTISIIRFNFGSFPPYIGNLVFTINISLHNVKSNKIDVILKDNVDCGFLTYRGYSYYLNEKSGKAEVITNNTENIVVKGNIMAVNLTAGNIIIEATAGNLKDKYSISTEVESVIYGAVGKTPDCTHGDLDHDPNLNSSMFVYNVNESTYKLVNIIDGRYYFFVKQGDTYEMYYVNNNGSLTLFQSVNKASVPGINVPKNKMICSEYCMYE